MHKIAIALSSITALLLASCTTEVSTSEVEQTGVVEETLSSEQTGVVEYAFRQYRTLAGVTLAGYATPDVNGCGAAMIGPNTLITAAHCGVISQATFRTYPNAGAAGAGSPVVSTYDCNYLVHTFGDTDINIYFCAPGPDGVNPGDRYGYLDMDPRRPAVNQSVYSTWTNQQPTPQVPVALMYSPGKITRTNLSESELWSVPTGRGSIGIESNAYGEAGASGSPQMDSLSNKIVVGPTSTAVPNGSRWRGALSIADYLFWGRAELGAPTPPVNTTFVTSLGLNPDSYMGWIDKELDNLFDIQTDIELARGEAVRDWYNLGFESARRNKLWTAPAGLATFGANFVTLSRIDGGASIALAHKRLNLGWGANYVLSGVLRRTSGNAEIFIGLRSDSGGWSGSWLSGMPFSIPVTATGPSSEIAVWLQGNGAFELSDLLLTRSDGGGMRLDFDWGDQRKLWNDAGEFPGPAFMIPDGRAPVAGVVNWALYVPKSTSRPYTARMGRLPVTPNRTYRVCFDLRLDSGGLSTWGRINLEGGSAAVNRKFFVGNSWGTTCVDSWSVAQSNASIQLGVDSGLPYRIDNLTFTIVP
jgi:hypothetical protein